MQLPFKLSLIDTISIRIVLFTLVSIVAVPYYFMEGGTILGFIIARIVATFFAAAGLIGLHRWLSHNSFVPSALGRKLMLVGMLLRGQGRPIHYVIAHRLHHVHSDTESDPHSPRYISLFKMWLGRFTTSQGKVPIPRDFYKHKDVVFLNEHYWKLYWAFNFVFACIDLKTALIFCPLTFALNSILVLWIVYFAHNGGKENIEPVNLGPITCVLTVGEALQLNHHENPSSYDFGGHGRRDPALWMVDKLLRQK